MRYYYNHVEILRGVNPVRSPVDPAGHNAQSACGCTTQLSSRYGQPRGVAGVEHWFYDAVLLHVTLIHTKKGRSGTLSYLLWRKKNIETWTLVMSKRVAHLVTSRTSLLSSSTGF